MNEELREEIAEVLRNFKDEGPRDLDVALDAIEASIISHYGKAPKRSEGE